MNRTLVAKFENDEQAKAALSSLENDPHFKAPPCKLSANMKSSSWCAISGMSLLRLFAVWIALGSFAGAVAGYVAVKSSGVEITDAGLIIASVAFSSVGAAVGMLVAGLIDTVMKGSLEENSEGPELVISAEIDDNSQEVIMKLLSDCGANQVQIDGSAVEMHQLLKAS